MARVLVGLLWAVLLVTSPARAALLAREICEQVTQIAAQQSGVPLDVMRAISLTETGRTIEGAYRAWPWAVNMEGEAAWFADRTSATAFVLEAYARGARSFDIGCFQINYKWHGAHFASIEQMFDPLANAQYAAHHLLELYAEKGNWRDAAGAYHSRTPEYANRYMARFESILAGLRGAPSGPLPQPMPDIPDIPDIVLAAYGAPTQPQPRVNRFPLLQAGDAGGLGSLVPRAAGSTTGLLHTTTAPLLQ